MIVHSTHGEQVFSGRREAGRILALGLRKYAGRRDVVVLALPRGGVPVAFEVANALGLELDVFVVRKLGLPGHEELAMGAIASGGVRVLNEQVVRYLPNAQAVLDSVAAVELLELERREAEYRRGRGPLELKAKTAILIDDGLATGATMRAAVRALRLHEVAKCVVTVPVAAPETCDELSRQVDEMVCLRTPEGFHGVGQFYEDFSQTSDDEVRELLARAGGWEGE